MPVPRLQARGGGTKRLVPSVDSDAQSYCGTGSRRRSCKPVWLPCRACGDGARGWREKGKSLGGRRAGPAAFQSCGRRRAASSLRASLRLQRALRRNLRPSPGAPCSSVPGPRPRTRRGQSAPGGGAAQSTGGFGGRSGLNLAAGPAGKEGESGDTLWPRRARIAHSQPRAPAEARPGRVWSRGWGPGTCPLRAPRPGPGPAPLTTPAPCLHGSPFDPGKRQRPDNLQAVAQLVSTPEVPEGCPGEVSFLRVHCSSSRDPPFGLELGGSESRMNPGDLSTLTLSVWCWR
ncbi:hypothetical protein AB1E18_006613 [Capra hircus]